MNDALKVTTLRFGPKTFLRRSVRLAVGISMVSLLSASLFAQYGGTMGSSGGMGTSGTMGSGGTTRTGSVTYGGGSSTPSYGKGKAIGIGVGAGAAGIAALYLMVHRGSSITGCVLSGDDGLRLTDEKTKRSYALYPSGAALVPGEHVQLRGKIVKTNTGEQDFEAKELVKNLGACSAQ